MKLLAKLTTALIVMLAMAAGAVLIAGCVVEVQQPTFVDRCSQCGEYLEDAAAAHKHFAECPVRYMRRDSEPEPCR